MMSHSEPESGGAIATYGMMAMLFGSLLCCAAWQWSDGEERNSPPVSPCGYKRPPGEHLCPELPLLASEWYQDLQTVRSGSRLGREEVAIR